LAAGTPPMSKYNEKNRKNLVSLIKSKSFEQMESPTGVLDDLMKITNFSSIARDYVFLTR
jgi:hypothetical protein